MAKIEDNSERQSNTHHRPDEHETKLRSDSQMDRNFTNCLHEAQRNNSNDTVKQAGLPDAHELFQQLGYDPTGKIISTSAQDGQVSKITPADASGEKPQIDNATYDADKFAQALKEAQDPGPSRLAIKLGTDPMASELAGAGTITDLGRDGRGKLDGTAEIKSKDGNSTYIAPHIDSSPDNVAETILTNQGKISYHDQSLSATVDGIRMSDNGRLLPSTEQQLTAGAQAAAAGKAGDGQSPEERQKRVSAYFNEVNKALQEHGIDYRLGITGDRIFARLTDGAGSGGPVVAASENKIPGLQGPPNANTDGGNKGAPGSQRSTQSPDHHESSKSADLTPEADGQAPQLQVRPAVPLSPVYM